MSKDNTAGVFVDGECVESSLLFRRYRRAGDPREIISAGEPVAPAERVEGAAIFAGYLVNHFGHFLLESLSRLWITREHPDLPLVWCPARGRPNGPYTGWQQEILDLLGVANEPVMIEEPTQFESLLVPEAGYMIQDKFEPEHARFLASVEPAPVVPGKRCWISRSKLTRGGLRHEDVLEDQLRADGWEIFHPEEHPISEQLGFLSSSETIAGLAGSAFHSLILLERLESRLKIIATRAAQNANYNTIADANGFTQEMFPMPAELYSKGRIGSQNQQILPNFSRVLDALDVPVRATAAPEHDGAAPRLINVIAGVIGARRYLELGVGSGETFSKVAVAGKTAVDPRFGFDPRGLAADGDPDFFEMTPEEYFTRFPDQEKADVVFINEVQASDDALRWFCGSLGLSHEKTVWVINNTKTVLLIHDLFPTIDYVTIDDANPQTLLWRAPRRDFVPLSGSLQELVGLDGLEPPLDREVMRYASEDDGLELLKAALGA